MKKTKAIINGLILTTLLIINVATHAEQWSELHEFTDLTSNPGNLLMFAYKPQSAGANAPMIVLLHGCLENAKTFALKTGWKKKADDLGIILLMPQQTELNNGVHCFTWYQASDITRGHGEVASIASMIDYMKGKFSIDPSRVFVAGISAGATMSAALMASYPEKIQAGAMVSGVFYGCAFSLLNSYDCMVAPGSDSAQTRGNYVRAANGNRSLHYPRILIAHGKSDKVVNFDNARYSVAQWLNVHKIDNQIDAKIDLGQGDYLETFEDLSAQVRVEFIPLAGRGHGWPVNTSAKCGFRGQFYLDGHLCLTDILARRWGLE